MVKKMILRAGRAVSTKPPQSEDYQTTTFAFDGANQLVSSTTDGVTTKYAYDAAGRLVREGSKAYRYGYLDKVLSVTDGKSKYTYGYHVDGQLATANYGDGKSESFLWDGLALVKRGDEQYINEPHVGGGNPVVSSKGTSYFNDMLGTTLGAKAKGKYSAAALSAFGEDLSVETNGGSSSHSTLSTLNSQFFTGKPYVATKQNHGWEHTISGGVSIWANFTILLELIYISTDENGNEESETITSSIRYGEFHCEHQKNIFE